MVRETEERSGGKTKNKEETHSISTTEPASRPASTHYHHARQPHSWTGPPSTIDQFTTSAECHSDANAGPALYHPLFLRHWIFAWTVYSLGMPSSLLLLSPLSSLLFPLFPPPSPLPLLLLSPLTIHADGYRDWMSIFGLIMDHRVFNGILYMYFYNAIVVLCIKKLKILTLTT